MNPDDKKGPRNGEKSTEAYKNEAISYFRNNTEAVITYVLLALGLLFLFFDRTLFGSLLIGLVAGYHFAPQILYYLRNLNQIFTGQDQVKYIVLTAVIIAFFIAIPGIFLGAIIAAIFKQVILGKEKEHD